MGLFPFSIIEKPPAKPVVMIELYPDNYSKFLHRESNACPDAELPGISLFMHPDQQFLYRLLCSPQSAF